MMSTELAEAGRVAGIEPDTAGLLKNTSTVGSCWNIPEGAGAVV